MLSFYLGGQRATLKSHCSESPRLDVGFSTTRSLFPSWAGLYAVGSVISIESCGHCTSQSREQVAMTADDKFMNIFLVCDRQQVPPTEVMILFERDTVGHERKKAGRQAVVD